MVAVISCFMLTVFKPLDKDVSVILVEENEVQSYIAGVVAGLE